MSKRQEADNKGVNKSSETKSVHDVCHSLNEGMPKPSGLVSRFEESLERFASVDAKALLDEIRNITEKN
ncbi:MAG: hypothetical protein K6E64_01650 [Lachnospiraceae bacterium]|nr:hypothetical protein [Lachnospiraceae bacterium]